MLLSTLCKRGCGQNYRYFFFTHILVCLVSPPSVVCVCVCFAALVVCKRWRFPVVAALVQSRRGHAILRSAGRNAYYLLDYCYGKVFFSNRTFLRLGWRARASAIIVYALPNIMRWYLPTLYRRVTINNWREGNFDMVKHGVRELCDDPQGSTN